MITDNNNNVITWNVILFDYFHPLIERQWSSSSFF